MQVSSRTLRVAIVGAGFVATRLHLPAFRRLSDVEVAALCDINEERVRRLAREYEIPRPYTDFQQLLADSDIDLAVIGTPNAFHAPMTIAALEAGMHVLVEKPMAVSVAETEAMIAAAEKADRILTVGLHMRWRPEARTLKEIVDAGILGDVYYAHSIHHRRSGIPGFGSWFTNRDLAGAGALYDVGVHALDLALWMLGHPEPCAVSAVGFMEMGPRQRGLGGWGADRGHDAARFDVDDLSVLLVRFRNGSSLSLEAAWAGYQSSEERLTLWGREGGAEFAPARYGSEAPLRIFQDLNGLPVVSTPEFPRSDLNSVAMQAQDVINAIREGRPPMVTGQQGRIATQILTAALQSAQTGGEVRVQ